MSHRDEHGRFWIVPEPGKCELCGAVEETRPYGREGTRQWVCG